MKRVGSAAGDKIHLHVRDAVTSVHIQLIGLDGHFFHVLDARFDERRGSAGKLHALCGAHHPIDVVSGRHVGQTVPGATGISGNQPRQG